MRSQVRYPALTLVSTILWGVLEFLALQRCRFGPYRRLGGGEAARRAVRLTTGKGGRAGNGRVGAEPN